MDETASSVNLVVKQNHNIIVYLDFSKYLEYFQPFIECVNHLVMKKALIHYKDIPLSSLILAYSTTIYNKSKDMMSFKIQGNMTSISKAHVWKLLVLHVGKAYSKPDHVSSANMLKVLHRLGCSPILFQLYRFMKSCFPLVWNVMFMIFFK
ncbi:unnamed protein product [Lactuca saligna]|uniref:Uncharacterized protein n=1 Tax=Lactuca saligna TaxID=75948 RepID=A0AA35UNF3_LACSI|nr:unnamed protein product [Lactuca saligna]